MKHTHEQGQVCAFATALRFLWGTQPTLTTRYHTALDELHYGTLWSLCQ